MTIAHELPTPVRSHFRREATRIQADVLRMGALVERSCWLAQQALFDRNLAAADQLPAQDKLIDQMNRQIELDCIKLITLQSPVAQDLRLLSTLMQLVRDLERIGDYAEDLGEIATRLFVYPVPDCMTDVRHMADLTWGMVSLSLAALTDLDAESGLLVKTRDDAVDDSYRQLYSQLANQSNIQGSVEPILLVMLVIRHLERMADHATNIGKRVAYIVTGQRS